MAKKNANKAGSIRQRPDGRWEGRVTVGINSATGITTETKNTVTLARDYTWTNNEVNPPQQVECNHVTARPLQDPAKLTFSGGNLRQASGSGFLGIVTDDNGVLRLVGGQSENKATFVFAKADKVVEPISAKNAVNHIDISIEGSTTIDVPLAFGTYYVGDSHEEWQVSGNTKVKLTKDVSITTEDMMRATITAYHRNSDGSITELDDAFYVTGYSANTSTNLSSDQVRIEGSFLVAQSDDAQGRKFRTVDTDRHNVYWSWWGMQYADQAYTEELWAWRLANRVYYNVSVVKPITFPLVNADGEQLYEKKTDGTFAPLSVTVDVTLSASFDYWDPRNECPPVNVDTNWQKGEICSHNLSGMDFVLGGDAENAGANVVAVEIMKLIVDENGHRIHPDQSFVQSFNLYRSGTASPNGVVGLDVNAYSEPYTGYDSGNYTMIHGKDLRVGTDGMGLVYDYDVTDGMFYIAENAADVQTGITDQNGLDWEYVDTYYETEYSWRTDGDENKSHVSDRFTPEEGNEELGRSIPDVLGRYTGVDGTNLRNGFLEFYVYNVYKPGKTQLDVEKTWENGAAPAEAEVDVVLGRYKLVPDGVDADTGVLTIHDSYSGTLEEGDEFSDLRKLL